MLGAADYMSIVHLGARLRHPPTRATNSYLYNKVSFYILYLKYYTFIYKNRL